MTTDEIAIVGQSWARVLPIVDAVMEDFYARLIKSDADVANLFSTTNMPTQRAHLADAINLVVDHLNDLDAIAGPLRELGVRHSGYGVREGDLGLVANALLETLAVALAEQWSDAHRAAWTSAWEALSAEVLVGLRSPQTA